MEDGEPKTPPVQKKRRSFFEKRLDLPSPQFSIMMEAGIFDIQRRSNNKTYVQDAEEGYDAKGARLGKKQRGKDLLQNKSWQHVQ